MGRCDKVLKKARTSATNFKFSDLCRLAECWGYDEKGGKGSHVKFKHSKLRLPKQHAMQVFQSRKGQAVPYQVKQLLKAIEHIEENYPNYYKEG